MELGSSTHWGRIAAIIAALLVCVSVPAVATAKITVPPGATEGDQYFEEAPTGGGSSSVDKGGPGGGPAGGAGSTAGAPVAATSELNKLGADGQAAAALANANRPPEQLKSHPIPNPSAQASPTEGDSGLGIFFPLLIIGTAFAAVAFLLRGRLNPA
jgi:hypothetical protein